MYSFLFLEPESLLCLVLFVIIMGFRFFVGNFYYISQTKASEMKSIYQAVSTEELETLLHLGSVTFLYHKKGGDLIRILATTSPYRIPNTGIRPVRYYKTKLAFYNLETGTWQRLNKTTFYWLVSTYPEDNEKFLTSL